MQMTDIAFGTTDWSTIAPEEHPGERGRALWRTRQFGTIRVRMVEYSPGYLADHWCSKGHISCASRASCTRSLPTDGAMSSRPA